MLYEHQKLKIWCLKYLKISKNPLVKKIASHFVKTQKKKKNLPRIQDKKEKKRPEKIFPEQTYHTTNFTIPVIDNGMFIVYVCK